MTSITNNEIFNDTSNNTISEGNNDIYASSGGGSKENYGGSDFRWREKLLAFSLNCSSSEQLIKKLKHSNKILLPESVLHSISKLDVEYPLFFQVKNTKNDFSQVCGVEEFTSPPGVCHLPYRIMDGLGITEGDTIDVALVSLVKGSFIRLKLHTSNFAKLSDPKAVLEQKLSKNYPVLTEGHTISIEHLDKTYYIDVTKCEPCETIQIINTNINVDFDKPMDYVEPPPKPDYDTNRFPGKGYRLGN